MSTETVRIKKKKADLLRECVDPGASIAPLIDRAIDVWLAQEGQEYRRQVLERLELWKRQPVPKVIKMISALEGLRDIPESA